MSLYKTNKKWMQKANEGMEEAGTKGSLRKSLKAKSGQKITARKLAAAAKSKNPLTRKRAVLAQTFRKIAAKRKRG